MAHWQSKSCELSNGKREGSDEVDVEEESVSRFMTGSLTQGSLLGTLGGQYEVKRRLLNCLNST